MRIVYNLMLVIVLYFQPMITSASASKASASDEKTHDRLEEVRVSLLAGGREALEILEQISSEMKALESSLFDGAFNNAENHITRVLTLKSEFAGMRKLELERIRVILEDLLGHLRYTSKEEDRSLYREISKPYDGLGRAMRGALRHFESSIRELAENVDLISNSTIFSPVQQTTLNNQADEAERIRKEYVDTHLENLELAMAELER